MVVSIDVKDKNKALVDASSIVYDDDGYYYIQSVAGEYYRAKAKGTVDLISRARAGLLLECEEFIRTLDIKK